MFKDNRKGSLWSLNRSIKKITEIRSKIKMILNDKIF
jgi:hypothetical protein